MPHYVRYLFVGREPFSLPALGAGSPAADAAWLIDDIRDQPPLRATVRYAGEPLAMLEFNPREEDIFREELDELRELVRNTPGPQQSHVQAQLAKTKGILAIEVLAVGDARDVALARLSGLLTWLFAHYAGLKHEDGVGFSDATGVLLEVK